MSTRRASTSRGSRLAALQRQSWGSAYPDLFAAIGVHSGLACGAARDMPSAFTAMKKGAHAPVGRHAAVPTIVFHGDRDATVHPVNGDHVIAQSVRTGATKQMESRGRAEGGMDYTRTVHSGADGRPVLEQWKVQGLAHAWSGGSPTGSYTDSKGPDASREMLRFFAAHARSG